MKKRFLQVVHPLLFTAFPILNAYYIPNEAASSLYPSITPVNSFRLIFDSYFGTDLGLLEDRNYLATYEMPYDISETSNTLEGS